MTESITLIQETVRRQLELLAEPIDVEQLVADGVLRPKGSGFELLDPGRLPEAAAAQIKTMRKSTDGPPVVRFAKTRKRAKRLLRRLKEKP